LQHAAVRAGLDLDGTSSGFRYESNRPGRRAANAKPLLCQADRTIVANAPDVAPPDLTIPRCELDDITDTADVVRSHRPTVGGVARVSSPP
jgi:hypothetical protein